MPFELRGLFVASQAGDPGQKHRAGSLPGAVSPDAGVETLLLLVHLGMATAAVELQRGAEGHDPVLERRMALDAGQVMLGDVHPMQQRRVGELAEARGLIVTGEAAGLLHGALAVGHLVMAGEAGDLVFDVLRVIHDVAGR